MKKTLAIIALLGLSPLAWAGQADAPPMNDAQALSRITLSVPSMTCGLCPVTIKAALDKVPGVTQARPDLDHKTVTVTFDPHKTNVKALTRATEDAGYPAHLVSSVK
ncbi:mercuric transport protein periplasmic component [Acidihalobacter yilgarnensis]|uniref:Periplasmic mercury ion-binding protein n=2 Tax=Acidihalobacter yilgarnensis TaxID=2819280 RepID=A0A1D8IPJ0_9GAMM|nr:mercury resistance system periplasmic binding protein MerP [Acidihalobacter yilgarnensis]AOU98418.1 mercuric transport protein periplasmic component [Acidihalobacter yilgarnensis]